MKKKEPGSLPEHDRKAYHYDLPEDRIAQFPAEKRDASRLLVVNCASDSVEHHHFSDIIKFLAPGDLLVLNDTRVFPARIHGRKETGGRVELFLLGYPHFEKSVSRANGEVPEGTWSRVEVAALLKCSKKPRPGGRLIFSERLSGTVQSTTADGQAKVTLNFQGDIDEILAAHGKMPLPPYIRRPEHENPEDRERYQTVFARQKGAVAAPTAGLHFTDELLAGIRQQGINTAALTLHVGYGTFAPVRVDDITEHRIHEEYVIIPEDTARMVNETRARGGRIWAVGTTTVRALEYAADSRGRVRQLSGLCGLYIYPGYRFKVVNNLITNFHLPGSSLLFLVSALAGRERILKCYREAMRSGYRFYSYGDAMVLIT